MNRRLLPACGKYYTTPAPKSPLPEKRFALRMPWLKSSSFGPTFCFSTSRCRGPLALTWFGASRKVSVGYLLKPVIAGELREAVTLAGKRIRQKNSEVRLEALLSNLETKENDDKKIGIPSEAGLEFVEAREILFCEGEDGYTGIHLRDGSKRLSSYSIGEYRKMLMPYNFFPVHRSYLVNRRHVARHDRSGSVTLSNGTKVAISRRRKDAVFKWLKAGI